MQYHEGDPPANLDMRPHWSAVLRALRELDGATQEALAAAIGVSRRTVRRWERGEAVPDAAAEQALIAYCGEHALFRRFEHGPLPGLMLTPRFLCDLLAEARLRGSAPAAPTQPVAPRLATT